MEEHDKWLLGKGTKPESMVGTWPKFDKNDLINRKYGKILFHSSDFFLLFSEKFL